MWMVCADQDGIDERCYDRYHSWLGQTYKLPIQPVGGDAWVRDFSPTSLQHSQREVMDGSETSVPQPENTVSGR